MSIINIDDSSRMHTIERAGSRTMIVGSKIINDGSQNALKEPKARTLRLDSPTTMQACRELGILVSELKPRTYDDFRQKNIEETIIEARFTHYMKKYNQLVRDVYAKRREINKARHRHHYLMQVQVAEQQQHTTNNTQTGAQTSRHNRVKSVNMPPLSARHQPTASLITPRTMKQSLLGPAAMLPTPMLDTFNKTMNYLRASHETPAVLKPEDLVDESLEGESMFTHVLGSEVSKFNKVKRQKQKQALDTFNEDMKRVKILEDMDEREKKQVVRQVRLVEDKKKSIDEKRQKAAEKLEKIHEAEKNYRLQKLREKEGMMKRLEDTKKKLAEEAEKRNKYIQEHEEKNFMRKKIHDERREQLKIEEQQKCDELKEEINKKLWRSEERHNMTLNFKIDRATEKVQKIEESVKKIREKNIQNEKEYVQKLVEKLVQKEEDIATYNKEHRRDQKKRDQEIKERRTKFSEHKGEIRQAQRDRMKEINDRFQKVKENLEKKKEHDDQNMRLRQELSNIRIQDKLDNYARKRRQRDHEHQLMLDRQQATQEKIDWLKSQKEILRLASVEVSIQSKIERERLEEGIKILSKITHETGKSVEINEQQKRLLQEILRPEDYMRIEEEENRKAEERYEAEERAKAGKGLQVVSKAR